MQFGIFALSLIIRFMYTYAGMYINMQSYLVQSLKVVGHVTPISARSNFKPVHNLHRVLISTLLTTSSTVTKHVITHHPVPNTTLQNIHTSLYITTKASGFVILHLASEFQKMTTANAPSHLGQY